MNAFKPGDEVLHRGQRLTLLKPSRGGWLAYTADDHTVWLKYPKHANPLHIPTNNRVTTCGAQRDGYQACRFGATIFIALTSELYYG